MLVRLLYAYPDLSPIRHDLFIFLGPWHNFHYGVIAIWMEFRSTFLGPAFFSLFPNELLKYRMPLVKSVTFFQWLRKAYPKFRQRLYAAIESCKMEVRRFESSIPSLCRENKKPPRCAHRSRYIHLINLMYLFEFALPTVMDYGILLKSGNYQDFRKALLHLILFYFTCEQKGTVLY